MKNSILILTALMLITGNASATETNYDIGKLAASEFRIDLGTRPSAMGGAFTALADDFNAPNWNAAGLTEITGMQVGFVHNIYLLDMAQEYLGYAESINDRSGLGINVMLVNYGTIDKVKDVNGLPEQNGTMTPMSIVGDIGYGLEINDMVSLGATIKVLSQNIDTYSATAFAVDLGSIIEPIKGLRLGLVMQNLGPEVDGYVLPMNGKLGAAYALPFILNKNDKWQLAAESEVLFGDNDYLSANIGTEYDYQDTLKIRAGYKIENKGEPGGSKGLSAGLGIKLNIFQIDYAFVSLGKLGSNHQIGFGVIF